MSLGSEDVRWHALQMVRPYLRNPYLDKGKWFLLNALNPKPGDSLAKYGTKLVQTRYGSHLYVDMRYTAHRFMYFTGEYEIPVSRLIARILRPGWRFVDVGANIGFYSLLGSKLADYVLSVEPHPLTRELLLKNLHINNATNVSLLPCALSDQHGQFDLHQTGFDIGGATLRFSSRKTATFGIDVVPGDSVILQDPLRRTLVKIDVEGWEFKVLQGWKDYLTHSDPVVILELTDSWLKDTGSSAKELFEFMSSLGYSAFEISWPRTKLKTVTRLSKVTQPPAMFQCDVLFAKHPSTEALWRSVNAT